MALLHRHLRNDAPQSLRRQAQHFHSPTAVTSIRTTDMLQQ
jgi:hypothetical protein